MIKKVTDINSLSGVSSPLLPLIYGDFHYSFNDTDGVFLQSDENETVTAVLSLKNASVTAVKIGASVDLNELESFFAFLGVTSVVSDFPLEHRCEKSFSLLLCEPRETDVPEIAKLSEKSGISEYKNIYRLLSRNGGSFDSWFPVFSRKINGHNAVAVYKAVEGFPVSTATATAVYNDSAVISGVFTSLDYRNKGYASECVKSLLSELHKSGIMKSYLWCENKNISFYKKLGFIFCGEVFVREEV